MAEQLNIARTIASAGLGEGNAVSRRPPLHLRQEDWSAEQQKQLDRNAVRLWLKSLNLEELYDVIIEAGFDTMDRLSNISMEDLDDIGVRRGHARAIVSALRGDVQHWKSSVVALLPKARVVELRAKEVVSAMKTIRGVQKRIHERCKTTQDDVRRTFTEMRDTLDEREETLLRALKSVQETKRSKLANQFDKLRAVLANISKSVAFARQALDEGSDDDIKRIAAQMLEKLGDLAQKKNPLVPVENGVVALSIAHDAVAGLRGIGRIVSICPEKCTATGHGLHEAVCSVPARFTVTIRDHVGEKLLAGGHSLDVRIETPEAGETTGPNGNRKSTALATRRAGQRRRGGKLSTKSQEVAGRQHFQKPIMAVVADNADGTYNVTFTPTEVTMHLVHVHVNGTPIEESPFRVRVASKKVFKFKQNGDKNGVLYWIGTDGWQNKYRNPAMTGNVTCEASSLYDGRVTDPVGRNPTNSCTLDQRNSWWCVDLGVHRSLVLMHYSLTNVSGSFSHALRNWRLEASKDCKSWTTLRTHKDDDSIKPVANATASWPVNSAATAYRYFCIIQIGPNNYNRNYLMLGGIELYGVLLENTGAVARHGLLASAAKLASSSSSPSSSQRTARQPPAQAQAPPAPYSSSYIDDAVGNGQQHRTVVVRRKR